MPWKETCAMKEKQLFIERAALAEVSFSQLCQEVGISRKTGYKLLARFAADPVGGLVDKRTTRHIPPRYPSEIFESIRALRLSKPTYGPEKLLAVLRASESDRRWPSVSTVKQFLDKCGLVKKRRRYRTCPVHRCPPQLREVTRPNEVWASDFKGWFRTGDERRCEPLTMLDLHSRFLLHCSSVASRRHTEVQPKFEAAFQEYGRPDAIRTDNGPPFGSPGLGHLSPLSVWLIKQGVYPEKIRPGHPEENGRIERFHRTLKAEAASPPAASLESQQQRFDEYRAEYNNDRPHAALGQQPPASRYLPGRYGPAPGYEYPEDMSKVSVSSKGYAVILGERIYLSESLANEWIGYTRNGEGYLIEFLGYPLGTLIIED